MLIINSGDPYGLTTALHFLYKATNKTEIKGFFNSRCCFRSHFLISIQLFIKTNLFCNK